MLNITNQNYGFGGTVGSMRKWTQCGAIWADKKMMDISTEKFSPGKNEKDFWENKEYPV